jgi:hypothetical protein
MLYSHHSSFSFSHSYVLYCVVVPSNEIMISQLSLNYKMSICLGEYRDVICRSLQLVQSDNECLPATKLGESFYPEHQCVFKNAKISRILVVESQTESLNKVNIFHHRQNALFTTLIISNRLTGDNLGRIIHTFCYHSENKKNLFALRI